MNRKLQPDSNAQRIDVHENEATPPYNGTVMVDMDKNRLIEIPPNGGEPPDIGLTRTW